MVCLFCGRLRNRIVKYRGGLLVHGLLLLRRHRVANLAFRAAPSSVAGGLSKGLMALASPSSPLR